MKLERNNHHVYMLMYHFVWIPKYRHKVFEEPYRSALKLMIRKAAYDYDMQVEELEIPEDHIHMVIKTLPRQSPAEVMQKIKSITAREFFGKYKKIKRKYFWGGKLWTQSYFVETVGNRDEASIRKYVQGQLEKMDKEEEAAKQLELL